MFKGLFVAVLVIMADQLTKFFADAQFIENKPLVVNEYFNLIKVWNTGVSFSMFNNHGKIGVILLSLFALLVVAFLLHWMYKELDKTKIIALGMIVGGALGNVIDRVRFGAVLDFLDFHYKSSHWPAFNVADSFICIGALILIILEIKDSRKKGLDEV